MGACNLLLMPYREEGMFEGFKRLARFVREIAPDVRPHVLYDGKHRLRRPLFALRPTFVFAPVRVRRFRPLRGRVACGRGIAKSDQYERLENAGLPVPRWARLREGAAPDLSAFGEYVVVKPDFGQRGADVRIVRRGRVRWKLRPSPSVSGNTDQVVQDFVYTGRWPEALRVVTLFGEPLFALRMAGDRGQRPLDSRFGFGVQGGVRIVAAARGSHWTMLDDPEALDLARRVHAVFPEVPTLGLDFARDIETNKLYVIEINPGGWTWLLHSKTGRDVQEQFGLDLAAQFDGERLAARVLAERARAEAC